MRAHVIPRLAGANPATTASRARRRAKKNAPAQTQRRSMGGRPKHTKGGVRCELYKHHRGLEFCRRSGDASLFLAGSPSCRRNEKIKNAHPAVCQVDTCKGGRGGERGNRARAWLKPPPPPPPPKRKRRGTRAPHNNTAHSHTWHSRLQAEIAAETVVSLGAVCVCVSRKQEAGREGGGGERGVARAHQNNQPRATQACPTPPHCYHAG